MSSSAALTEPASFFCFEWTLPAAVSPSLSLAPSLAPVPPHPAIVVVAIFTNEWTAESGAASEWLTHSLARSLAGRRRRQRAIHHRVQLAMTRGEKSGKEEGTWQ